MACSMAELSLREAFEKEGLLTGENKSAGEILLLAVEKGPKKAFQKFGGMKNPIVQRLVENGVFDLKQNKVGLDSFDGLGLSLAIGVGLGWFTRVPTEAKGSEKK